MSDTNDLFFANILCPWGCTNFVYNCGHIDLDILIQRVLGNFILVILNY